MKKLLIFLTIITFAHLLFSEKKIFVAVIELDADGITRSEARTITNKLRTELLNTGKFDVIERGKMKAILEEQGFQQTGCTNNKCAVKMGQLIGVRKIIAGSVGKIESSYIISIRMIDISKGNIEKSVDEEIAGSLSDLYKVGIHNVARKIAGLKKGLLRLKIKNDKSKDGITIVKFVNLKIDDELYLDQNRKLIIDGNKNQRIRKSIIPISTGRHVMHWNFNYGLRYYYEFIVKRGENYILPKFFENRLPALSCHLKWRKNKKNRKEVDREYKYFIYDEKNNKNKNSAHLKLSLSISKKDTNSDKFIFKYRWTVKLNGKLISRDKTTEIRPMSAKGTHHKKIIIYSDKYHYYAIKYYIIKNASGYEINSGYIK